jgi:hypothetical protein
MLCKNWLFLSMFASRLACRFGLAGCLDVIMVVVFASHTKQHINPTPQGKSVYHRHGNVRGPLLEEHAAVPEAHVVGHGHPVAGHRRARQDDGEGARSCLVQHDGGTLVSNLPVHEELPEGYPQAAAARGRRKEKSSEITGGKVCLFNGKGSLFLPASARIYRRKSAKLGRVPSLRGV